MLLIIAAIVQNLGQSHRCVMAHLRVLALVFAIITLLQASSIAATPVQVCYRATYLNL